MYCHLKSKSSVFIDMISKGTNRVFEQDKCNEQGETNEQGEMNKERQRRNITAIRISVRDGEIKKTQTKKKRN